MTTGPVARSGRLLTCLAVAGAMAFGVSACGDDDDEGGETGDTTEETAEATGTTGESASAEEVTLTAVEYDFELSATPTEETTSVNFVNDGEEFHVLIFAKINEGFTLEEAIKAEGEKGTAEMIGEAEAAPGESATVELKEPLEPGSYAMLCPITSKMSEGVPHYELGQLQEFDIE